MVLLRNDQIPYCSPTPPRENDGPLIDHIAAFKRRACASYRISHRQHVLLVALHCIYALACAVLAPFFHNSFTFINATLDGSRPGNFPTYNPAAGRTDTPSGVIDPSDFYTFDAVSETVAVAPFDTSIFATYASLLADTDNNALLYFLNGLAVAAAIVAVPLYIRAGRREPKLELLIADIVCKLVSLAIHVLLMSRPTLSRMIICCALASLNVSQLIPVVYIAQHVWSSRRRRGLYLRFPASRAVIDKLGAIFKSDASSPLKTATTTTPSSPTTTTANSASFAPDTKEVLRTVDSIDASLEFWSVRMRMDALYAKGRKFFILLTAVLVFLTLSNFLVEFIKIMNSQGEFLPLTVVSGMNADRMQDQAALVRTTSANFPNNAPTRNKVVIVLLDGLRLDYFHQNPEMQALFSDPAIAADAKLFSMTCQLPSMSLPNWLTIMTGAPPESTGLLNNIAAPETNYDSIFSRAKQQDWLRGATGSPTLPALIRSALPKLIGDGSVDPAFGAKGSATTALLADRERLGVALEAINGTNGIFKLFFAHFSDIDIQGHSFGVKPSYNKDDSYNAAVTEKAQHLRKIYNAVDSDTVVITLADHGQVDAGGHGGTSTDNMQVPLVAYKKGSGFRDTVGVDLFPQPWSNLDVAATVTALLGIGVPAQSQGKIITSWLDQLLPSNNATEARRLAVKDLLRQKQNYVLNMFNVMGVSFLIDPNLVRDVGADPPSYAAESYAQDVDDLMAAYDYHRLQYFRRIIVRNAIVHLVLVILIISFNLWVMERYTFTFPTRIFRSAYRRAHLPDRPSTTASGKHLPTSDAVLGAHWKDDLLYTIAKNRTAFWITGGVIAAQIVTSALIFFLYYYFRGYGFLDSTILHHPRVLPQFVGALLVTSIVLQILVSRLFVLMQAKWPTAEEETGRRKIEAGVPPSRYERWRRIISMLFSDSNVRYRDIQMVYLLKVYALLWTNVAVCAIFLAMSAYTFVVPLTFEMPFVEAATWPLRFRIISLECMFIPVLIGHLFGLTSWPRKAIDREQSFMDPVYAMGALKLHFADRKNRRPRDSMDPERPLILPPSSVVVEVDRPPPTPTTPTTPTSKGAGAGEGVPSNVIVPMDDPLRRPSAPQYEDFRDERDDPALCTGILIGEYYSVFAESSRTRYGDVRNLLDAVRIPNKEE